MLPGARRSKSSRKRPPSYVVSGLGAPVESKDADYKSITKRLENTRKMSARTRRQPDDGSVYVRTRAFMKEAFESSAAFAVEQMLTFVSLVGTVLYVYGTYLHNEGPLPTWFKACEWLIFVLFLMDYILRVFVADHRFVYMLSGSAMVDLLTILPIATINQGYSVGFLRILRVFRLARIVRSSRMFGVRKGVGRNTGVSRQIGVIIFIVFAYIFIAAGVVHTLEVLRPGSFRWPRSDTCDFEAFEDTIGMEMWHLPEHCVFSFFQATYFMLITVTTVGYGDMFPLDTLSRFIILLIFVPLFFIIPKEVSKLSELVEKQPQFRRSFSPGPRGHVVVCGDLQYPSVETFLIEFYHQDHGEQLKRVVLLSPSAPSREMQDLIQDQKLEGKAQYIHGSPLSSSDLAKARLFDADAVFLLTSQHAEDAVRTDATAVLMVKAMKAICPWVPVFLQLRLPQSTVHNWAEWDYLLCIQEFKMGLLAKSCLCPGFSTLIGNLITSSSEFSVEDLDPDDRAWADEYMSGYGQEIYCVPLSPAFTSKLFVVACNVCFLHFNVCMFAVKTYIDTPHRNGGGDGPDDELEDVEDFDKWERDRIEQANTQILINPKDYQIREGDKALLIADDVKDASCVSTWDGTSPVHLANLSCITPANKTTYKMLNEGRGPLLKHARPKTSRSRTSSMAEGDAANGIRLPAESKSSMASLSDLMANMVVNTGAGAGSGGGGAGPSTAAANGGGGGGGAGGAGGAGATYVDGVEGIPISPDVSPALPPRHLAGVTSPSPSQSAGGLQSPPSPPFAGTASGNSGGFADDVSHFSNHIVICGYSEALPDLVRALRRSTTMAIVVLDNFAEKPSPLLPEPLQRHVWFVDGSPKKVEDLRRAGMDMANVALVLFQGGAKSSTSEMFSMGAADIDAVFTVCVIEVYFSACRTLVELLDADSMKFLNFKPRDDAAVPHPVWAQFASGRVYTSNVLDTLICQAFYNHSLIDVLDRLISGPKPKAKPSGRPSVGGPPSDPGTSAGKLAMLRAGNSSRSLTSAAAAGAGGNTKTPKFTYTEHGNLVQMKVPAPFVGMEYRFLFMELVLTRSVLPLGLYRTNTIRQANLPYVIANPAPDLVLSGEDRLFVLCSESLMSKLPKM